MSYIKPMNCMEFANHLLRMEDGDTVEFGCDPGVNWPEESPSVEDVTYWYFARIVRIPEYCSSFILIDYCGGEEAFAIPLNNYKDSRDADDIKTVPEYVKRFFCGSCRSLGSITDYVFVEMEE